jgi:3-oxoacyl-[acyl-carrier-protein] synthase-1
MSAQTLSIAGTGLVNAVGLSAPAACAAIRAKLTNPSPTAFKDRTGEWIMSHTTPLEVELRGIDKLARMAAMAIEEAMTHVPRDEWTKIPLLLCVAESSRAGRTASLDESLFERIMAELSGVSFAASSAVVPDGRVGVGVALLRARALIYESNAPAVLVVGVDSLLSWPVLKPLEVQSRLLTQGNSNGFIPGDAAAAILVSRPSEKPQLSIDGLGFATEPATIETEEPLRGDGMARAMKAALADAGREMHHIDFRIADISGEQYYFKEAALALARVLRVRKEEVDLWHPAESIGEIGSAIGPTMLAFADAAAR